MSVAAAPELAPGTSTATPLSNPIIRIARRGISFEVQPSSASAHNRLHLTHIDQQTWSRLTAKVAGLVISRLSPLIPGLQVNAVLVSLGAWFDSLTASVNVQVVASEEATVLLASALGLALAQGEVLVIGSSGGPNLAVEVLSLDGRPVGSLPAVLPLWSACRFVSGGLLTGFTPLRRRNLDGFVAIDLESAWPSPAQASRWILEAAAQVGTRVSIRQRHVSAVSVENDWRAQPHGEGYRHRLVAAGRGNLALHAAELAFEVRSLLAQAASPTSTPPPFGDPSCRPLHRRGCGGHRSRRRSAHSAGAVS